NPGNVATGAPGLGRIAPFAPPPVRFDFFPASGCGVPFLPADAESGEPGIANLGPGAGAGAGFDDWAVAEGPQARAATQLAAQSVRLRRADIRASRPRSRARRQILPLADDRAAERSPELVLALPRRRREAVRAAAERA